MGMKHPAKAVHLDVRLAEDRSSSRRVAARRWLSLPRFAQSRQKQMLCACRTRLAQTLNTTLNLTSPQAEQLDL